jgi:hypothetical protein
MNDFTKKVDDLNPGTTPMVKTDFGLWLLAQKKKPSSRQMVTIPLYLETLGYERGKDVIDSRVISNLGYIHSDYWYKRMQAHDMSQRVGYYDLVDTGD